MEGFATYRGLPFPATIAIFIFVFVDPDIISLRKPNRIYVDEFVFKWSGCISVEFLLTATCILSFV